MVRQSRVSFCVFLEVVFRVDKKQLTMFNIEEAPGRPMLYWLGKRTLRAVKYYEVQLREQYGEPDENGWFNRLYWGDNLQVMSHLMREFRGKIKLIYIDPPFDSKADYRKRIKLMGKQLESDLSVIEEKQYTDIWANDLYLQFMYERLQLIRELLSEDGSIFLHSDWHKNHHLRCLMDEVFGETCFVNEIIWKRKQATSFARKQFGIINDTIFWYAKSQEYTFNPIYSKDDDKTKNYIRERFKYKDKDGRLYMKSPLVNPLNRPNLKYVFKGINPPPTGWLYSKEKMEQLYQNGELIIPDEPNKRIYRKIYLDNYEGQLVQNIWDDIPIVNPMAIERENFPTQKPEALLERIINTASNPGDLVVDFFCGSGTTLAVAQKLKRHWIGSDINLGAIHTTARRLSRIINEEQAARQQTFLDEEKKFYPAFAVYNVNHYDIFKNALEAKEIVMKLYGIEPVKRSFFDGILDGKWVKVVDLNRVCSKEDVQTVFDEILSKGEKEIEATYRRGVIILCSGHEYDVLEHAKRLNVVNISFEIRDILTDRKDIIFKRPPEADIVLRQDDDKVVIEVRQFYSPMLLQKLQLEDNPEKIEDWRQIVEAVLIDPSYDGEVLRPSIQDIPGKKDMVTGVYEVSVTEPGQKIAVKIVDVLSEEYFEVLEVGAK